ncbi:MAG: hypothetical protein ABIP34_02905 [Rhodoferax sp.]|uniref:hypothetical protein n=1 Tax=Rhodoferax sp. TaxID=50421 RepID=UPI003267D699
MKIAILGWGSLLWDTRTDFDSTHGPWELDGPNLPIEFTRVSKTRGGALTLVIDHDYGAVCTCVFALSTRSNPDDAISDLRCREGTTLANIGYYFADGSRQNSSTDKTLNIVRQWAETTKIDVVVWTDLKSNFASKSKLKQPFSIPSAISHLQSLSVDAKASAAEYMWRAPALVDTALRRAVEIAPWFNTDG